MRSDENCKHEETRVVRVFLAPSDPCLGSLIVEVCVECDKKLRTVAVS